MNLAVAAHPDDIEFGMGATISTLRNFTCILSFQCNELRREEARASLVKLGVAHNSIFFTQSADPRNLIKEYDQLFSKIQPSRVFSHFYGDSHQEHRLVYDCVTSALRKFPKTSYLLWENNQPGATTHEIFNPRIFIPVNHENMLAKLEALTENVSQMKKYDTASLFSFLWNKAQTNGYLCGVRYAEAFLPIKYVLES
jgi:LmbE family N-acetylglucosaminyl deacetylase